jgi:hypothetical protein
VVNARAAFTRSVQAYEQALARASATSSAGSTPLAEPASEEIEELRRRKDQRRGRLLDAQRRWNEIRPEPAPDSPIRTWIGAGELRGWSLGLIGFESALLRIEHALDPNCWVVLETSRLRLGPAVGAERLRLGVLIEGATIEHLTGLIREAMGSPEFAFRPGASLGRWLSQRRLSSRSALRSLRKTVDESSRMYTNGIGEPSRRPVLAYLLAERGLDLNDRNAGLLRPSRVLRLRIGSSGPSLLIGAWIGRKPSVHILAGSNHQAWIRSSRT